MLHFRIVAGAAALAVMLPSAALAAAPDVAGPAAHPAPAERFELNTEVVVRNWVLCVSQAYAEELVRASDTGVSEAAAAISRLAGDRSCGLFAEMRVILQAPVFESSPFAAHQAKAYAAQIDLGGRWIPAFVVYGSQPRD